VLEFCRQAGTKRMLFVSSGAVYGKQPATVPHVPETYAGSPDPLAPGNAYAEGKRAGEFLCAAFAAANDLEIPIARPFAFLGPGLPLERHFAAGNFLADALAGRPLAVNGDGTPYRSYMYPTDLTAWLLTILAKGQSGRAYNVGSDEAVTIGELGPADCRPGRWPAGCHRQKARPRTGRPSGMCRASTGLGTSLGFAGMSACRKLFRAP